MIADTPGSNPMTEKIEHNIQIAGALNYKKARKKMTTFLRYVCTLIRFSEETLTLIQNYY